jgi:hypothetical protein
MVGLCIDELVNHIIRALLINNTLLPMDDEALIDMVAEALEQFIDYELADYKKSHPYFINQVQAPNAYGALITAINFLAPKMIYEQCVQYTAFLYDKTPETVNTTMAPAIGNGVSGRYYIPMVVHVYGSRYSCTGLRRPAITSTYRNEIWQRSKLSLWHSWRWRS